MTDIWDLYVIEYARSKAQPWVDLISGMYDDGTVDLPFSFLLAQQGERNVLIDTGFMQDENSSGFSRKFGIPDWISPVRMLGEIGVKAEAITDIVITHAHFDHMGSIAEFPNARIFIQKSELLTWYEMIALPKRFGYLTAIIDPDNLRTALEASIEHRVTLVDGDADNILPGLHVSEGGQSATGATLDHILRWFGRREEVALTLHDRVNARLQVLLAEAGGDLGRDLHVLPDFNGNRSPQADPFARAVISGLTLDTSFDALCILYWRAAVGLAAGLRQIIGHMRQGASPASRLHVTGGHVRNPLLIQLYADMTGLPLFVPQEPDAVLLGTAMLAASAGGLHPGLEAAARAMASPLEEIVPDRSRRAAFDRDRILLRLEVREDNLPAIALYEGLGFETHHAYRYLAPPRSD